MVTDQTMTLQAIKTAIQMEIDGKEFYLKAAEASTNDLGRQLFRSLAAEEDIHRVKFEEIFRAIGAKKAWPGLKLTPHGRELKTLFTGAARNVKAAKNELDAIRTAMEMENKTRDFYQERAGKASFDAEKQFYLALVGQESTHHALLLDYFEYLQNPAQYFTMKERHSLDGG
jgi:rubrerythrin